MSIESLKQQARKHEQNEDWKKALDQYNRALKELAREDQVDIGLYNRVGDLYVRVGNLEAAVENYDRAVELYREAYLPNNAIAVCKKIIRNVPDRHRAYLVIGQIRAEQGFIPDARTNFLTYAERMQQAGDLDESFRALIEFCDLAPDDVGVRLSVADQMIAHDRVDDAVEQLLQVRRHYTELGKTSEATDIESRVLALKPDADLAGLAATLSSSESEELLSDFGEIAMGAVDLDSGSEDEVSLDIAGAMEEGASEIELEAGDAEVGDFEISSDSDDEPEVELPMMEDDGGFDFGGADEEEAEPLPMMADDDGDAPELPMMEVELGEDEEDIGPVELPTMDFGTEETDSFDVGEESAAEAMAEAVEEATADVEIAMEDAGTVEIGGDPSWEETTAEPAAEMDFGAPVEAAPGPETFHEPEPEPALPEPAAPVPEPEPMPSQEAAPAAPEPAAGGDDGGYVDLGAMILGGGGEKSTRFTVAYEEPGGDEEADFAKMLSQFKDKVSENLDSSDVRAHYDLGTAYKEMGLLEEAISSFQAALRASADHLPTYELMGQTFMEMGKPEAAVKSLERALETAHTVEDELVGIYYYLGRAYEALQNRTSAVEYYDRVFSLDINFADVTERLRELR